MDFFEFADAAHDDGGACRLLAPTVETGATWGRPQAAAGDVREPHDARPCSASPRIARPAA